MGDWPHGICRQEFLDNADIDFEKFQNESLSQILDYSQYWGLDEEGWRSIIFDASNPDEVRNNIEKAFPEIEIFCYRWNQALCYFPEWIKNGDNFLWLSMIRNPLDRAVSSFEKHKWQFEDSLKNTMSFLEKLQHAKESDKFRLFYYEDLVENPEKTIADMYSFFEVDIPNINLIDIKGSNGEDFIPQSSLIENVYTKKDGYLTDAAKFNGLYKSGMNRYKRDMFKQPDGTEIYMMDEETLEAFKIYLSKSPEYNRYF